MKILFKLRILIKPYKGHFIGAMVTLAGVTIAQLLIPKIIQDVVDIGLVEGKISVLINSALIILGIGIIRAVLAFFQRYWSEYISMHIAYDLRNNLYNHIQNLSFSYHNHAQTGQLMSRCTEDVRSMQQFIGTGFVELLQIVLIMLGTVGLMLLDNPKLALIALIPMIPMVFITTNFGGRASKLFYAIDKALGDLSSKLQENVTGVQVVRAFTREPFEIDRFDQTNRELYDARITVISEWAKIMPTTAFLVSASTLLILWFGGQMAINGEMTVGQIVAFNSYMLMLAMPARQLTWFVNSAGEAAAGVKRVFEILEHDPIIQTPSNAISEKDIKGNVEFKNVSFAYDKGEDPTLSDLNFTAKPNEIVALIGPTGSGKTSLVNMIPRFFDTSEGQVLIDGVDVHEYDLINLRRKIGIVLQTSLLFSASIKENIAFGNPDAKEEDIFSAAKAAQAYEFINKMPEGFDTIVGERGITLSGGQRQRIAIARAILINPRILILDDSTSSVDTETEHLIKMALNTLMQGRTTFVIAQRLSTVRNADQILVMDKGKIVEIGKHSDLLKKEGLYKEIYDLQLSQQEEFIKELKTLDTQNGEGSNGN
ncbi:MAG: ABC transporter ATP-binding protein [Chloroflexi bacterium]|jgi:ABC-type multidrug transport system fused ATPase/permease subunit|nr:ABC transporter ATP-binding protein [Chloroflexota bacterium]MBT3670852.1 ABC transporter ATP-binding protein [Chloroflexota bacterium]MBT4004324.1 ABC transporter ATP-binding protein [Chloroflexota bacterium]MBT4305311.1 ABC transporter ATP-binding protein [Chloroflexota bacterium]MBT4532457.1 ABC transporter ATP-binding protein [Chloroflexota bacterium]